MSSAAKQNWSKIRDGRGLLVYAPDLPEPRRVYWRMRAWWQGRLPAEDAWFASNADVRIVSAAVDPRHAKQLRNVIQRLGMISDDTRPPLPAARLLWTAAENSDRAARVNTGLLNYHAAMVNLADRRYHQAPGEELATYEATITEARNSLISLATDGPTAPETVWKSSAGSIES